MILCYSSFAIFLCSFFNTRTSPSLFFKDVDPKCCILKLGVVSNSKSYLAVSRTRILTDHISMGTMGQLLYLGIRGSTHT